VRRLLGGRTAPGREPPSPGALLLVALGVIYDSQPAIMHKNTTTNRWNIFNEKSPKTTFYVKNLSQDIIQAHFVWNRSRLKTIFTSGYFEAYLFEVSGVKYAPSHPD
jgi:hypothetical protein